MRAFPPRRRGVLIPLGDRRTAAAGVALYTPSKRWVVLAQQVAFAVVRLGGARLLPGRTEHWNPPCPPAQWKALVAQWEECLGPLTGFATYQRRQRARTGLTLVVTRDGEAVAIVKIRDEEGSLAMEQAALSVVGSGSPRQFRVPQPLGSGRVDGLVWAAQQCVFDRPHSAVLDMPEAFFVEVSTLLRPVFASQDSPAPTDEMRDTACEPSHGDLTPWNLRRDRHGAVWLFDWEDVELATVGSDRTYFAVMARTLVDRLMPSDLPGPAVTRWRRVLLERLAAAPEDASLAERALILLDAADAARDGVRPSNQEPAQPRCDDG